MTRAVVNLADEAATEALGAVLQAYRPERGCVHLIGDLGAGKTTLMRGFLRAAGHPGAVRSPTYTLVEPYAFGSRWVYHLDLYRLADPEELEFIGLRELVDTGLLLVEWPLRGEGVLPAPDLSVRLEAMGAGRQAVLERLTPQWPAPAGIIEAMG
ncbi:hypothetical protein SPICUR_02770 [Spiribacter curvatus]|uniref:tRNA threonylcarbamoyladenosine biosynthesis protein TsaE n=1 Tax=Spiribacter curvatus TaxID=1335757 RepID=U5T1Z5_9GAMM|nr:tRNA (adenosine(37)-N6)-threonylcarbamoyltransferase complex ATPase subunit type 1 TsaE [Spiribacter curvatus]AGY91564.1 hypothetical protein SPICUR_02770 [Spiribacter curvatus]